MKSVLILLIGGLLLTVVRGSSLPRGIRNNNPGNIRRTRDRWQGLAAEQQDPDFFQFKHPRYGFRAMARILRNYQRRGLTTLREMISTYAPPTENNTDAYIRSVANQLNINPDVELSLEPSLFALIKAMTAVENGRLFRRFYDDDTIREGIALA